MKKVISLALALWICFSLCACSNVCSCDCEYCCSAETQGNTSSKTQSETISKQSADKIEFAEPVLLAEDDRIRVEVTNFFQEVSPYSGHEPEKDKFITLNLYNKTDFEIRVRLEQLSIGNDAADCKYHQAQVPEILPGKSIVCFFGINLNLNDLVASMEDLYRLEGVIEVKRVEPRIENGRTQYDTRKIPFSVYDAFNGNITVAAPVTEQVSMTETTEAAQPRELKFQPPVLLAEDKNLRLEIVDFYQDVWEPTGKEPITRAHITIKFNNKANYEMMITPDLFYIGDERVDCVQSDGTPHLLAGKNGSYAFNIRYDTDEELESLEDLYQLNGRFEVYRYENDTLYDGYYFPIDVSEAFS